MVVMVVAGEEDARVQGDGAPAGLASACGLASPRHPAHAPPRAHASPSGAIERRLGRGPGAPATCRLRD